MKIVVVIEGREAIPVRAIPLLSNWRFMSPDVVAHVLGDTGGTNVSVFGQMQSSRLSEGKVVSMNKDWWAQFPLGDLKALSEKIKASESSLEAGKAEWKKSSLNELPAGVFVWKTDYEKLHEKNWTSQFKMIYCALRDSDPDAETDESDEDVETLMQLSLTRAAMVNDSPLKRDLRESLLVLQRWQVPDYAPFMRPEMRKVVMEGFESQPLEAAARNSMQTPGCSFRGQNYATLAGLIEPYADGPFDRLPGGLQEHVIKAFSPMPQWDDLGPDQRRSLAQQYDSEHDPAMAPENRYWFELSCRIQETESEITRWELMSDRGIPSEALIRRDALIALRHRSQDLKELWGLPAFTVEDWDKYTDDLLRNLLGKSSNHDQEKADTQRDVAPQVSSPPSADIGTRTEAETASLGHSESPHELAFKASSSETEPPRPIPVRPEARHMRRDVLTPVIEKAQRLCEDAFDAPTVWVKLRQMADEKISPLLGVADEGLQWIDSEDHVQYLSLANLRDRLRRKRNRATVARA